MKFEKAIKTSWGKHTIKLHKMARKLKEEIDNPYPDWKFSPLDFAYLSYGLIPQQMEDKWFAYMDEQNIFRTYRSWTNYHIDEFRFEKKGKIYYIRKLVHNANPRMSGPSSPNVIECTISNAKNHIKLCSHCLKEIKKGDRTIMNTKKLNDISKKIKEFEEKLLGIDSKIKPDHSYYHHLCHRKKYPHKLDKSIH